MISVKESGTQDILHKASAGERITDAEALALFRSSDILALGETADRIRFRLHPEKVVTYIVDRNINYTNVCITLCKFCAFYRLPNDKEGGYTLTRDQLYKKIEETVQVGGVQILLQGGHHPNYTIEWYEDMLRFMKSSFKIHVHGFSPSEIEHIAKVSKLSLRDTLERLHKAGLDTIPGGGAEILVDRVRDVISPLKTTSDGWLNVMRTAHGLGIRTTATMVYGHVETLEERVEHLRRLRELQDETGGFTAFIAWSMQPCKTVLHSDLEHLVPTGGFEYLKTLAIARIYLDNIPNMQSSWVTQGDKIGQMALKYGANDMGSTMIEENVVSAAGANFRLNEGQIRRVIEDFGYMPRRRDCYYRMID